MIRQKLLLSGAMLFAGALGMLFFNAPNVLASQENCNQLNRSAEVSYDSTEECENPCELYEDSCPPVDPCAEDPTLAECTPV